MDTRGAEDPSYEKELALYDYWRTLLKRKKLIIGLIIIFILGAAIISLLMPNIFRVETNFILAGKEIITTTDIIAAKEIITAKEIVSIIGRIDKEKIQHIFKNTYKDIDDINLNVHRESMEKFQLIIYTPKKENISAVIAEFIDYIKNNPLIIRFVEQNRKLLLKQAAELSEVIESSNELVKGYDNLIKNGRLIAIGFNPVDLKKKISDMRVQKFLIEQNLNRIKGIELAALPYISGKPVKPKIGLYIFLAGVFSFFLGVFLASFLEYLDRNKLNMWKNRI